jgi:hypothetical protein
MIIVILFLTCATVPLGKEEERKRGEVISGGEKMGELRRPILTKIMLVG